MQINAMWCIVKVMCQHNNKPIHATNKIDEVLLITWSI